MILLSISEEVYEQQINEYVDVLRNGRKIISCGLGKNVPICEKFVGIMNSLGVDERFLHANKAVHGGSWNDKIKQFWENNKKAFAEKKLIVFDAPICQRYIRNNCIYGGNLYLPKLVKNYKRWIPDI